MSQVFEWDVAFEEPAVGDKVVISDPSNALIRPFVTPDPENEIEGDAEEKVIGTVYAKSGRLTQFSSSFDGPLYAMFGPYTTHEDLTQPKDFFGSPITNPAQENIQPFTDSRLKIISTGKVFTAIKKPYSGTFHVVMTHTDYDWILI